MIILIILIIVLLLSFNLLKNLFKNEETILDDVKLREESSNNGFALMLEQEDGTYKESSSSSWPTDMSFNSELSGCIDIDGNKINNALSFNSSTNVVTLQTNKTAYCYLYFDVATIEDLCIGNEFSSCLVNNETLVGDLWKSTLEDDGYRYVGTDPNNYICFGTSDKDTCVNDTDKYMYRIIGIFEGDDGKNYAKLIKKEALNTVYAWNSDYSIDTDWNNSDLYKGINGSYFLTNADYSYMQNSAWTNKIATWTYTMTNTKSYENIVNNSVYGSFYYYETGKTMYLHELNRNGKANEICHKYNGTVDCNVGEWKTFDGKISLMYASDLTLALGEAALSYTCNLNRSTLKTGWMNIKNNDSGTLAEWTMTRVGSQIGETNGLPVYADGYRYMALYVAECVYNDAGMGGDNVSHSRFVRPAFYLESDVELASNSGDGSITNPFIIKE